MGCHKAITERVTSTGRRFPQSAARHRMAAGTLAGLSGDAGRSERECVPQSCGCVGGTREIERSQE